MLYDLYDDFWELGLNRELKKFIQGNNTQKTFPEVNIYESKDKYMVLAKIPGVDKKDIQISIKDNALKLSGEIKSKDSNKTYYLTERISGSFKRNFMFDEKIDAEKVFAELKNGILTIDLPKSEDAKPKVITIA
ncbi:MAG: Hsp20/alpha crystallin family protein [Spirochaetales bacterium]|nr:Hsp20/alpha crystallin family protein [Spirochaetales bacterium]